MRLFDAKSSHLAIRHIYVVMAAIGLVLLILIPPVVGYLAVVDQEVSNNLSFDDPEFMYYHNVGNALLVGGSLLAIGGGLLIISPIVAVGYMLIRRGKKFESLKLKGSNVD